MNLEKLSRGVEVSFPTWFLFRLDVIPHVPELTGRKFD
jgi:hypothetical protein